MDRVLVTPRSLTETRHPALRRLQEAGFDVVCSAPGVLPDTQELIRLVPGCVGWLAGVEPVSRAVIDAASQLQVISRNGVGVDNLPLELLRDRGIAVVVADGANAPGVAELTIALMLAALRRIPQTDAGVKAGGWPRLKGAEIRGRSVGVVGCGAVGSEVARLAGALGACVMAHDPLRPAVDHLPGSFRWVSLETLLAEAQIVTLHCPPSKGPALIDRAALSSMRAGAILVNTARASLVDESALVEALVQDRLAVYATDVHSEEPPRSLTLVNQPNVIATSHIGGYTQESVDRAATIAVQNLIERLGR